MRQTVEVLSHSMVLLVLHSSVFLTLKKTNALYLQVIAWSPFNGIQKRKGSEVMEHETNHHAWHSYRNNSFVYQMQLHLLCEKFGTILWETCR